MSTNEIIIEDVVGKTQSILLDREKVAFVEIVIDEDPQVPVEIQHGFGDRKRVKPADFDCNGTIFVFNSQDDADEGSRLIREEKAIPLSCFKHSGEKWGIMGELDGIPDARWDLTPYAGVWIPDEGSLENVAHFMQTPSHPFHDGKAPDEVNVLKHYVRSVLDEFNAYSNGHVYGYTLDVYPVKRDDDGEPILDKDYYPAKGEGEHDSLYGIYGGTDAVIDAIQEALNHD